MEISPLEGMAAAGEAADIGRIGLKFRHLAEADSSGSGSYRWVRRGDMAHGPAVRSHGLPERALDPLYEPTAPLVRAAEIQDVAVVVDKLTNDRVEIFFPVLQPGVQLR